MRDIKFRCWNKETKSFHYWGVDIEGCTFIGPLSGKQPANKYEHQQFTGLRDQNGKEIYEGDICRDEDGLGVVYWEKDCWMYGFVLFDSSYKSDGYMLREMTNDCEIIGNIYENHSLLEVPHDTKI